MNHAIRITLPYADCSGIIQQWANRCVSAVVYQHDADEEVSKTHVHIGLYGCEVQYEALKRMWPDAPGKGNAFWSFKDKYEDKDGKMVPVDEGNITYMSKGHLRPVFVKNFSNELVERFRQSWVEPSLGNDRTKDPSDAIIRQIMSYFTISKIPGYFHDDDDTTIGNDSIELLFDQVRSRAFKVLWAQHRKAPHASYYKIVASTAFLRLCEDNNRFEAGAQIVREKWY